MEIYLFIIRERETIATLSRGGPLGGLSNARSDLQISDNVAASRSSPRSEALAGYAAQDKSRLLSQHRSVLASPRSRRQSILPQSTEVLWQWLSLPSRYILFLLWSVLRVGAGEQSPSLLTTYTSCYPVKLSDGNRLKGLARYSPR